MSNSKDYHDDASNGITIKGDHEIIQDNSCPNFKTVVNFAKLIMFNESTFLRILRAMDQIQ